jgi:hypothetical protein
LHLLNDADLQTLQRHNAYYTDEILNYLRAEPIIGNCYFWSAPHQPFVLPVRVADFESVCQKPAAITAASPPKKLPELVAQGVQQALTGNSRVWLYPVSSFNGKKEDGWVAFSADYLHSAVAQATGADTDELTREIAVVLQRHKARSGYAVLEGVTRRVWAIPQSRLKFKAGKKPRPTSVEITDKL